MSDEGSPGGRGPSSIKPPTIKPPTARADDWGATSLSSAPPPSFGAMPQSAAPPLAAPSPPQRRQRNVGLWIVAGVWLFFILMLALGVVVYLSLR
jgi:hypothetical protein